MMLLQHIGKYKHSLTDGTFKIQKYCLTDDVNARADSDFWETLRLSSTPSPLPLTPAVPSNTTATACTSTDIMVNQATPKLHYTLPPGVHPAMVPPSDPQLAAKWFACIWCRAGGCRPDWCEYRGWTHFATNIVMVGNLKHSVIRKS